VINRYLQPDRTDEIAYHSAQYKGTDILGVLPGDRPWQTAQGSFDDIKQALILVLAKEGLNIKDVPLSTLNNLAQMIADDAQLYQTYDAAGHTVTSTFTTALDNALFDPNLSENSGLLQIGLRMLQTAGKQMTQQQQATLATMPGVAIQPIDLSKYPVTETRAEGDPGVDYGTPVGTPVVSPFAGTIQIDSSGQRNWGLRVIVHLDNGWMFGIGHLSSTSLRNGQRITPGQLIGLTGGAVGDPNSGITTGPHVEFQWISPGNNPLGPVNSGWQDPVPMLKGLSAGVAPGSVTASQNVTSIITSVAQSLGIPADLALATAYVESKFNPAAIGDSGHSVGLFQLHDQGEGYGMSVAQREDPATNARVALTEFARVRAANPGIVNNPGLWAAMAQRPADQALYAQLVNSALGQIRSGSIPTADYSMAGGQSFLDELKSKYPSLWSAWQKYFGTNPTSQFLQGAIAAGATDPGSADAYVRNLPSHIKGMNVGQYTDIKAAADASSQNYFGHATTDGIVAELFNLYGGAVSAKEIQSWYGYTSANQLAADHYQAIYNANLPYMESVYNTSGFDPRVADQQYQQYVSQAGGTPYYGPTYQGQGYQGALAPVSQQSQTQLARDIAHR
jgi:murein DD-endopeptidase MepM/ murein hydrolase activator NlpD